MVDYSPALMTDMYEYTMLDASLKDGTANRKCVFEVYTRHLPEGRRYGVVAGIGRILDELSRFLLSDEDLRFLSDRKVVSKETISWLENLHFSGSIKGYREGEMFFPNSPILQVEGTFGECTLLETLVLSVLNYDSAVASAASRMVSAAKDRPCMDMGGRRTNEWAAVAAARAAVIGGFQGTANLLAAQLYGLKAIGTAAHCFTLVHDDERSAFASQVEALGRNTTLLVDTYNVEEAVKTPWRSPVLSWAACASIRAIWPPWRSACATSWTPWARRTRRSPSPTIWTSTRWPPCRARRWTRTAWARCWSPAPVPRPARWCTSSPSARIRLA